MYIFMKLSPLAMSLISLLFESWWRAGGERQAISHFLITVSGGYFSMYLRS